MRFSKGSLHFLFLSFLCWRNRNRNKKKDKWKKAPKPYRNSVVLRWSSKDVKNKKWIFSKTCLTLFVSGREKNAFSCTLSVLAKIFVGPKQCKPGNAIKIVVSAEIAQNQKCHLFLKKVFFDMGEKVGFTNCVFGKLCVCVCFFSENKVVA